MQTLSLLLSDTLVLTGAVAVTYGAYAMAPQVGWVVGGAIAVAAGLVRGYVESRGGSR